MFEIEKVEKINKKEYNDEIKMLGRELASFQRVARELDIPVMVIFEGLDASGKGSVINEMLLALDPKFYRVYSNTGETDEEFHRPFFWRFWKELPQKGELGIFDRSWYYSAAKDIYKSKIKKKEFERRCKEIADTEKLLTENGMIIIKFFLYISKKEQKSRLEKLEENSSTSWKVTKEDWESNKNFEKINGIYEELITKTNSETCHWNLICSENLKNCKLKVFRKLIDELEERFYEKKPLKTAELGKAKKNYNLDTINLEHDITKKYYETTLKKYQKRLLELEHEIYTRRIPVILAYEGWDAGGKGGNIKRVVERLDPRGYDVIPISAPNDIEKKYNYLWRFWNKIPKDGHIGIFDRTWYGRVLVERVEGFCSEDEWKRAFNEINMVEKQWADDGVLILKFWIHIDKDEQLKRFKEREETEYKKWKITEEDWRNREKWDEYQIAVEELLNRTDTKYAPWHVIEGNSKWHARLKALKTIVDAIEEKLAE